MQDSEPIPADCVLANWKRWWLVLPTLCSAVLIVQMDTSIVNLAVQPIRQYFGVGMGLMQWVVDSYNLLYAALLLTGGQLADLYGRQRLFMTGIIVFVMASVLCALSPGISWLIAGRALAGAGAALLLPATLAIIRVIWPEPGERGRALGIWAACNGLALAVGPPLGGVLLHMFGWRGIFIVAIPFGVTAAMLARTVIPRSCAPGRRHFDMPGQLSGIFMLGGLATAAIEIHGSFMVAMGAFLVSVLGLILFLKTETSKGSSALVPLDLFRVSRFARAMLATAGMTFGMYGVLFLLPLKWQSMGQLGAVESGLALLPMALVFVMVSPMSGKLVSRWGAAPMTGGGVGVIATGLLLLGLTAGSASLIGAEIGCALTGLGMGLATGPLMGIAVESVPATRSGTASALVNVARMTGATLGVAVLGTIYTLAGGGADGLRLAMLTGGLLQITVAGIAWRTPRAEARDGLV